MCHFEDPPNHESLTVRRGQLQRAALLDTATGGTHHRRPWWLHAPRSARQGGEFTAEIRSNQHDFAWVGWSRTSTSVRRAVVVVVVVVVTRCSFCRRLIGVWVFVCMYVCVCSGAFGLCCTVWVD